MYYIISYDYALCFETGVMTYVLATYFMNEFAVLWRFYVEIRLSKQPNHSIQIK